MIQAEHENSLSILKSNETKYRKYALGISPQTATTRTVERRKLSPGKK